MLKCQASKSFAIAAICLALASCGSDEPQVPVSKAVAYQVISFRDISFAGRRRLEESILAPTAKTADERAQTALKAAMDLQRSDGADEVSANLEISQPLVGRGFALAIADYAPDGGGLSGGEPFQNGSWQATATGYVVSSQDVKIAELWYQNENKFLKNDGFGGKTTDEGRLEKYLAKKIGIKPSAVTLLPLMKIISTRKRYHIGAT